MKTSHFPKKERNILLSLLPPSFWPLAHSAVALAHNPQDVAMAAAPPAAQGIAGIVYTALPSPAIIYHGNISSLPFLPCVPSCQCRSLKGLREGRQLPLLSPQSQRRGMLRRFCPYVNPCIRTSFVDQRLPCLDHLYSVRYTQIYRCTDVRQEQQG